MFRGILTLTLSLSALARRPRLRRWPKAPKGAFNLTMRLYSPKSEALTGKWNPPPIVRTQGTVGLSAQ